MKKDKPSRKLKDYFQAVGRRKTATASVRLSLGKGDKVLVCDKAPEEYFGFKTASSIFLKPLEIVGRLNNFNLTAKVKSGGKKAQIKAIRLGVARALIKYDPELRSTLKKEGFLTRDPRKKERKKPGLKRARRAPQWSKR